MSTQPVVTPTNQHFWINRHDTFKQPVNNLFDIANGSTGNVLNDYNATTRAIQQTVGSAIRQNIRLRALGGGWSFSKVAATEGWLLNTKQLNIVAEMASDNILPQFPRSPKNLLFVQCGNSIQELNTYLKKNNKSLKTCGASNGQTIVGAFSTGTHGSAIDAGATPDFIRGMHIIVSDTWHVWLERASDPVVTGAFVEKLQTQLVRDDDMFNAALVGLGSFGFIHGVMIETEDIYLLEAYRMRTPLDDSLKHVMETLDFSQANMLPHGPERPFHFQVVVNQYDLVHGAYVTVMYKRPYNTNYQPPVVDAGKAGPGDDVPAFLGKLTDGLPVVTHLMVNQLIKTAFPLFSNVSGTLGEIFSNNDTRGKVLSTAMGIRSADVNQVNELLIELNKSHGPFSGVFSYRYVTKSQALLAFTKYEHTCIVELDGIESSITRNFYQVVWKELDARKIPYTFHWGKIGNMNAGKIMSMYQSNLTKWIKARNDLMPAESLKIFSNELLTTWGLDTVLQQLKPV